ncbi:YceK/YidQ family lipoprotein [Yersinia kristensenii]|uniref:YceK/YidQ family lipoprotein n=1 Tax=Yersinia kristensenii TaxID=28152 RepID=UPI000B70220B|nr:YceK/YidQ family lipoprotein [Yersinia kristensenii]MBW5814129.1 YceK/YidQ family lipoprotein [Yersinia kristensenii]MBW5815633.1 YceK/YidQ family lipoprotein [Yersinia kristensenii]MBW5826903.1 YceK/YidQ family lipoprotein [Yersinia kristensenii]MBW5831317.1 YceK/YidQ family lipoprotein [Yersinia kristensenii]MBW5843798.1 YceK/YidQ family lipoprotein [Yersinia kristensenii]
MKNTVIPFVTGCSLLLSSGCSSIMTHTSSSQGYYSGTAANVAMLKDDNTGWALRPLLAVDLPFSAVMDTLLLPYDYLRSDNEDKMANSPRERIRQSEEQNPPTVPPAATPLP